MSYVRSKCPTYHFIINASDIEVIELKWTPSENNINLIRVILMILHMLLNVIPMPLTRRTKDGYTGDGKIILHEIRLHDKLSENKISISLLTSKYIKQLEEPNRMDKMAMRQKIIKILSIII